MNLTKKEARIAGLLYLLMGITGAFGMMYVPSVIFVAQDAAATAGKIINSEMLFRLGIMSNLICQITFIFLVLALDRLFKGVNDKYSKMMVSLVIASVPIAVIIEFSQVAAILLLNGADYLKAFQSDQIKAMVFFFLNLHEQGILIAGLFWGLWLFPFGYLIIKSGFIPKIFGVLLLIGCFTYLIDSFTALLVPKFRDLISPYLMLPLSVGEISTIFWLLIIGVKEIKPFENKKKERSKI